MVISFFLSLKMYEENGFRKKSWGYSVLLSRNGYVRKKKILFYRLPLSLLNLQISSKPPLPGFKMHGGVKFRYQLS